jgi:hypothetical protein
LQPIPFSDHPIKANHNQEGSLEFRDQHTYQTYNGALPYNVNVKSPVGSGSRSVAFTNLPIKQAIQNN